MLIPSANVVLDSPLKNKIKWKKLKLKKPFSSHQVPLINPKNSYFELI